MSLPIPLTVRLSTSKADRIVTRDLRDLSFREVANGGFASAQMSLDRPLSLDAPEIAHYGRVYVYDARNGRVVWEGRLEDPGQTAGDDGQVWELSALGPSAHAHDKTIPLIYVDSKLDGWVVGPDSASANYVEISMKNDDGAGVIQMRVGNGSTFGAGAAGMAGYNMLYFTGQSLARVSMSWASGFTSSNNEVRLGTGLADGATVAVETDSITSTSGTLVGQRNGSNDITAGHDSIRVRFARVTSNFAVADETHWVEFADIAVRARLFSAGGTILNSGYGSDTVLASEIVDDLLGRLLSQFDGANANVETTTHGIDQLSYPDGVDAAGVLADLEELEPGFRWGAYESNSAGLHRFEYVAWPTTIRYEVPSWDGFSAPGSADGLWDSVRVRWRDATGLPHTTHVTTTVAELDAAGITRSALIDLGSEVGSSGNATRAGQQWLAEHGTAQAAGRLTVASPIVDRIEGRMVQPWEIKAGQLIRVRDVQPRASALTATGRDGISVFKIASRDYRTNDAAAVLELDTYSISTVNALADLQLPRRKRRRQ